MRLITGGSGFLAGEILSRYDSNVRLVSRNEGKLLIAKQKFPFVDVVMGDIADPYICKKAMDGVDEVFHTAAFKHVVLSDQQPYECIKTNVIGTMNILNESLVTKPKFLVFISTDKAINVNCVYGATKYLGEVLMREYQKLNPATKYRVVRYGNVFGSTGSVIQIWADKMRKGQEVIITDLEATRYFWTRREAVDFIFKSIEAEDATPSLPTMKAIQMGTLLEACMEVYGNVPYKVIGLQTGENKHETMDGVKTSKESEKYSKDEVIQMLRDL